MNSIKIKRMFISILLAILIVFLLLCVVCFADYVIIIAFIMIPIGILAVTIYEALSEY